MGRQHVLPVTSTWSRMPAKILSTFVSGCTRGTCCASTRCSHVLAQIVYKLVCVAHSARHTERLRAWRLARSCCLCVPVTCTNRRSWKLCDVPRIVVVVLGIPLHSTRLLGPNLRSQMK